MAKTGVNKSRGNSMPSSNTAVNSSTFVSRLRFG